MKRLISFILIWTLFISGNAQFAFSKLATLYAEDGNYKDAIEYEKKSLELIESLFGKNCQDYAMSLSRLARYNYYIGNYQDAVKFGSIAVEIRKDILGEQHPDYAFALGNLAAYNAGLGDHRSAIELGTQAAEIIKCIYGDKSLEYIKSINNLGEYYDNIDDTQEAIKFGSHAAEICKEILGENSQDYAISLSHLADYYDKIGNYHEAIRLGTIAMKIRKNIFGINHLDYAESLNGLACYNANMGIHSEAIRLGTLAAEIRKQILGSHHPDYAESINNLAIYNKDCGNYLDAIKLCTIAMEIRKQILGSNHPDYAESLHTLSCIYAEIGNYQEAIRLGKSAIDIYKVIFGERHSLVASIECDLAAYCDNVGNYQEAVRFGELALDIRKEIFGEKHPDVASSLSSLATHYNNLGNYQEAIRFEKLALDIRKEIFGERHPMVASSLNSLAALYDNLGNYQEAIKHGELALSIFKEIFGERHPDVATSLNDLAVHYDNIGNSQEAIRLGLLSVELQKNIYGNKHPHYAASLNNLASFYYSSGNYKMALKKCLEAMEVRREILGEQHPDFLNSILWISLYYYYNGEKEQLKSTILNYGNKILNSIKSQFSYLPIKERQLLWDKVIYPFEIIHEYIYAYPDKDFIKCGYNCALFSKGILLNSEQDFTRFLTKTGSRDLQNDFNVIITIRAQLNKLYKKDIEDSHINADSLERHVVKLERLLMAKCQKFGDYTESLSITMVDVKKKLSQGDAAIEFVSFPLTNDSTMYMAYVLRHDMETPVLVKLFEEKEISSLSDDDLYKKTKGSELIWSRLQSELNGVNNVYFAPDGVLYQIGIESFPDFDNSEKLISERFNLFRLSSTRQLAIKNQPITCNNAVIYGGIQYDITPDVMVAESSKYDFPSLRGMLPFYNVADSLSIRSGLDFLKFTLKEATSVSDLLQNAHKPYQLISGNEATEESFKNLSGNKNGILHIATHGFYWGKDEADYRADANERLLFMSQFDDNARRNIEDKALTRTGLFMAGANNALTGKDIPDYVDDGILTAQEIANLDFRGLDLVVLSACQTGMGDISSDGVFGLQRGFKKAGAYSILMSLWDVNDEATQILMTEFYKNYLDGMSKRESLLAAQKAVRETPGFENPEYWAAFILLDALN